MRPPARVLSRRQFLEVSSIAGAGLWIGFRLPVRAAASAAAAAADLNAWIRIGTDESVTLIVSESEMGQGVLTSLSMILADELEADWTQVRAEHAPADQRYGNQSTGGSSSIRTGYHNLRQAGAAAREMLVRAAAQSWQVDRSSCHAESGAVVQAATGRRLTYGQLAERAALIPAPAEPRLKDRSQFRYIGKPIKRLDTLPKVTGTAQFGIDVRVPGMLTAQVVHSPVFGGRLRRFDGAPALAVPGVRSVVPIPSGVAVVADHYWAAARGREALRVTWDDGGWGDLSSEKITGMLKELAQGGTEARRDGDPEAAIARAGRRLEVAYELPYLAHATMEPMNCTADVRADRCEIWAPTQAPTSTRRTAARITGLDLDRITVHTTFMGGGFGRRSQTDFVADAVAISKAVGRPVKVVYTREDDMRGGYYRPAAYNAMRGAVDTDGWPLAWVHRIASPSIIEMMTGSLAGGIDRTSVEGARNLPYAIPNLQVTYARPELPITLHFWRSVGSSLNGYVTECFLDELAQLGGKDPVALRQRLLTAHPRHRRLVDLVAEKSGWGTPLPRGRGRGVAVHESFGSIVAQVAEVSVDGAGRVRVHRVVCAVDCGDVVNPDTVVAQMESGIVYGLSAALYGEITIDRGGAVQGNFDTYPVLRIDEMPVIETHIVTSGDPLGGIGEPGTPPIAAAVCNAIFAATGKRIRRLPIRQVA